MHTVIETPTCIRGLEKSGVDADERQGIIDMLAADPTAGDLIEGTGGARKVATPNPAAGRAAATE